jgi:hypothetical protein
MADRYEPKLTCCDEVSYTSHTKFRLYSSSGFVAEYFKGKNWHRLELCVTFIHWLQRTHGIEPMNIYKELLLRFNEIGQCSMHFNTGRQVFWGPWKDNRPPVLISSGNGIFSSLELGARGVFSARKSRDLHSEQWISPSCMNLPFSFLEI